jgi:hypothetical protein
MLAGRLAPWETEYALPGIDESVGRGRKDNLVTGLIEKRFLRVSALGITNARYFRIVQISRCN